MAKMILVLLLLMGLTSLVGTAAAEPVEVVVEGEAPTKEGAVAKALVQALQQVTGVTITASQQNTTMLTAIARENGSTSASLSEESQAGLTSQTNGIIRSYRVIDFSDAAGPPFSVRLAVVVELYKPKGLPNDNRRRLAVMPFTDGSGRPSLQGRLLQQRLSAYLVQTRRFTVLDRDNDTAYKNEMDVIASNATPPAERARLGQMIGADYIVVGHVQGATSKTTETNIVITGEVARHTTTISGKADYSLIEIATRQVKWTGLVVVDASDDVAAARIGAGIIEAIYPLRIIDVSDPKELVVNQGGDSMRVGQRYKAFVLSTELFDPYTKESLGRREREFGTVEVVRVLPKMSYARLVNGSLPDPSADIVIRRATGGTPATQPRVTPQQQNTSNLSGPLVLPFE